MELRTYQEEARQAVERDWEEGFLRTLLVLPTGCGKTIVFAKVVEDMVREGRDRKSTRLNSSHMA